MHWTRLRAAQRDWLDWAFILSVVWLTLALALTSGDEGFVLPLRFTLGLWLLSWGLRRRRGRIAG